MAALTARRGACPNCGSGLCIVTQADHWDCDACGINGIAYSSNPRTISGIAYPVEEDMTPERPGRPAIGPMVNVRLPEELIAKLDEHAAYYGISRAEVIRLLLTIEIEEGGSYSTRILERILGKKG